MYERLTFLLIALLLITPFTRLNLQMSSALMMSLSVAPISCHLIWKRPCTLYKNNPWRYSTGHRQRQARY